MSIRIKPVLETAQAVLEERIGMHTLIPALHEEYLRRERAQILRLNGGVQGWKLSVSQQKVLWGTFGVAAYIHRGEPRDIGGAYISHPVDAALKIAEAALAQISNGTLSRREYEESILPLVCIALLHDTAETLTDSTKQQSFALARPIPDRKSSLEAVLSAHHAIMEDALTPGWEKKRHSCHRCRIEARP